MSRATPPSVVIAQTPDASDAALAALRAGLEEEGVPSSLHPDATADVRAAAAASALRIGLALDAGGARLDVRRARDEAPAPPVLEAPAADLAGVRLLGQDAGRMAKGAVLRRPADLDPFTPPPPRTQDRSST